MHTHHLCCMRVHACPHARRRLRIDFDDSCFSIVPLSAMKAFLFMVILLCSLLTCVAETSPINKVVQVLRQRNFMRSFLRGARSSPRTSHSQGHKPVT